MKAAYKIVYYVGGQRMGPPETAECPGCKKRRATKAAAMKRYRARRKKAGRRVK